MIDLTNNAAKERSRVEAERNMSQLIIRFSKVLKPIINRQYIDAAKLVSRFDGDIDFATNKHKKRMEMIVENYYRKTATVFSNRAFTAIDTHNNTKGISLKELPPAEEDLSLEFWAIMAGWITKQTKRQVNEINWTTKRMVAQVVKKGIADGLDNKEIATKIRKAGNITSPWRARRIARTETHSVAEKATITVMIASRIILEKEWLTAMDEKVRRGLFNHVRAQGETVGLREYYVNTGEALMHPGDSAGSAGNIANCRCFENFSTRLAI